MSRLVLVICALAAACAGCASPRKPAATSPTGEPDRAFAIDGVWRWSRISSQDGVRRVEVETWRLDQDGDLIDGEYQREVTHLSEDALPFVCNQDLHYRLTTSYKLRGRADGSGTLLEEVVANALPSPCEDGQRPLMGYRLIEVTAERLVLESELGRQILERLDPASVEPTPARERSASGRWSWRNRQDTAAGHIRVEREIWSLETGRDTLSGHYQRTVTVFDPDGRAIPCAGASSYSYTDRYRVRGWGDDDHLTIEEVAFEAGKNPCAVTTRRTLDAGVGRVLGDSLAIEWRGGNRQVLRRDHGSSAAK